MKYIYAIFVTCFIGGCTSVSPKYLTKDDSKLFEIKNRYTKDDDFLKNKQGRKASFGFDLCQGIYRSIYKGRKGTYFEADEGVKNEICDDLNCWSPCLKGIWISDNESDPHRFKIWLPVGKTRGGNGVLIDLLDSSEWGNLKIMNAYISSEEVIKEILQSFVIKKIDDESSQ